MSNLTGQTIGQYQLTEKLGAGGMAEVYKAYQPRLDRYVALKFIRPELAVDDNFRARFEQEARAIAQLSHGNIVHIYDFGEEAHRYFLVMEYVPGQTLKQFLQGQTQSGEIASLADVVRILRQVGSALDYAHGRGIVHRDVKPDNIMLTDDGRAVLNDFGIAKLVEGEGHGLTQTGTAVGTPAYMAPEQIQGIKEQIGPATDLYALGVILYELLTGQTPFTADTPFAVMLKHVSDPVPLPHTLNPDLPPDLEAVLLKSLAKDPAERYQRAGELVTAVEQATTATNMPLPTPLTVGADIVPTTVDPSSAETMLEPAEPTVMAVVETVVAESHVQTDDEAPPRRSRRKIAVGVIGFLLVACVLLSILGSLAERNANTAVVEEETNTGYITFTAGNQIYRVAAVAGAVPENISARLDEAMPGEDNTLNISPDGAWLVVETTRADETCAGWACLAILPSSLALAEAQTIYTPSFDVVHTDSLPALARDAEKLIYVSEGENSRDLYLIERDDADGSWEEPTMLSVESPFAWNDNPRIHPTDDVALFTCGDEPYGAVGTAVCEVDLDNRQVEILIRPEDGPPVGDSPVGLYVADYLPDDSIVFSARWRGADIWQSLADRETLEPVVALDPPLEGDLACTLPDGRVAVLDWVAELEGPLIRVVSLDGTTDFVVEFPQAVNYDSVGCGGG